MITRRRAIFSILGAALAMAFGTADGAAGKAQTHTVTIRGGAFTPASLTIRAGDTVTWTNGDDRDHTVSAADGSFDSGNIRPGGAYAKQFNRAGKFAYSCSLHPRMRGTITVQ